MVGALLFLEHLLKAVYLLVELIQFGSKLGFLKIDLLFSFYFQAIASRHVKHVRRVVHAAHLAKKISGYESTQLVPKPKAAVWPYSLLDSLEALDDLLFLLFHLLDLLLQIGRRVLRGHQMVVVLVRLFELLNHVLVLSSQ